LIIGSTGLAGQAFARELQERNIAWQGLARSGADLNVDIAEPSSLRSVLEQARPDLVINCAAVVNLARCENDLGLTWPVNAGCVAVLSEWSKDHDKPLLHVSTDHFFDSGGAAPHSEEDPVQLLNVYAAQKFAAEAFARTAPRALVLRTSIVGLRGASEPTFAEWAIDTIENDRPVTLFADAYGSSIDADSFARYATDLIEKGHAGLLNLAAGEVYSKERFILALAQRMGRRLSEARHGSVAELLPRRPRCLGLDVTKAERALGRRLPTLDQVIEAVVGSRAA
jgi:dTDP-4-dehydrorhamnose reductase